MAISIIITIWMVVVLIASTYLMLKTSTSGWATPAVIVAQIVNYGIIALILLVVWGIVQIPSF